MDPSDFKIKKKLMTVWQFSLRIKDYLQHISLYPNTCSILKYVLPLTTTPCYKVYQRVLQLHNGDETKLPNT
jgi:hypothetical protein